MANICGFIMKVRGRKEDIELFYKALSQDGKVWMGRGAEAVLEFEDDDLASIAGNCSWSIRSALQDNALSMRYQPQIWDFGAGVSSKDLEFITLYEACERWNLIMEVYSEESGMGFQEHYICDKGKVSYEEHEDWEEYWVDEYETKEEAEEKLGVEFTDEEWETRGDTITRGGFNWDFEI